LKITKSCTNIPVHTKWTSVRQFWCIAGCVLWYIY